ncbi:hypothetical protein HYV43_04715 [Candidatus Micrarchaeota archaeon]|nr:hypothetical protein [Candidatus Micrarchaeota archaeon]
MDFVEARLWLDRLPEPSTWELDRMRRLVADAGVDATRLKAVQVAGTNGKGSTCAFLSAILQAAGFKTGLYTSPHLLDLRERIQIDGKMVTQSDFAAIASWAQPLVEKHGASQFEAYTLMAFRHFLDQRVDWAVVEVGLGGKKDATSILAPRLSIITHVAMDHMEQLGGTVTEIAEEKAGIIPENGVCLTTAEGNAYGAIEINAKQKEARLKKVAPLPIVTESPLCIRVGTQIVTLALQGRFQAENAALAVAAAQELQNQGTAISEADIVAGLRHATWPGRMQTVGNVVIDGAHNPDGIAALVSALKAAYPNQKWNLVFGVLADKDYPEMVRSIRKLPLDSIRLIRPKSPRALPAETLVPLFKAHQTPVDVQVAANMHDVLGALKGKPILVCGSLYVAADALQHMEERSRN